jgi:hypothetical protein
MILSKNFTDPFDTNPIDGPLPPFPSHLKIKLKSISGPHESNFWRNIYHRIPSPHEVLQDIPQMVNLNMESEWRFDMGRSEIESLRQLIQEQSRRIEILEDQITSERMNHESEIIRFMEHHRGEIDALKRRSTTQYDHHQHRVTSEIDLSPSWSRKSHRHSKSSNSLNQSPLRLRGFGSPTRSFETERITSFRPSHSSPDGDGSKTLSFSSTKNRDSSPSKYSSLFPSPRDHPLVVQPVDDEQKEEATPGRRTPYQTQSADIFPEMSRDGNSRSPHDYSTERKDMKFHFEKTIPEEDSDFLRYLENFQSELRSFH